MVAEYVLVRLARVPRPPVADPTLGVKVEVDRTGRPANRLVTIGDSITQVFMSGAIFRTDLSWPNMVAFELGLRLGVGFRYPVYEPPTGPGGLPFDLERAIRGLEEVVGDRLDWYEAVRALRWAQSYLDDIEDYWERGPGLNVPATTAPYHNLAVYGADILDVLLLDADRIAKRLERKPRDDPFAQIVDRSNDRAWRVVLESCRSADRGARTVIGAARAMGDEGLEGGGAGPGIETLVVMLGANHALGAVVHRDARWTPGDYLGQSPRRRLNSKGAYNVWQPPHFADEWGLLVEAVKSINARHVIIATVPQVTIAPIARGWRGKVYRGSPVLPVLHPAVDQRRRLRRRPGSASDRVGSSTDRLGDRRLQRVDHRVREGRSQGRPRLVSVRHGRAARQTGITAVRGGSGRPACLVEAVRAATGAEDHDTDPEHRVLPVWPRGPHRRRPLLARRRPSDHDRLRRHCP
jgi:hypothetical protein